SQLRSTNGTFDTTPFVNPSGSLTINRGSAFDTITVSALPDFSAGLTIGSAVNPLGGIMFAGDISLAADKSLVAFAIGTIGLVDSKLAVDGKGQLSLT